jgi:D-alanyl-D-alanine carboxypeptidase
MVKAAADYPLIRDATTTSSHYVEVQPTGALLGFNNTNSLVRGGEWDIQVSKTGFIREAGKCLVMLTTIASRPIVIVLLDSVGRLTRIGDANRVKHWLETGEAMPVIKTIKGVIKPKHPPKVATSSSSAQWRARRSSTAFLLSQTAASRPFLPVGSRIAAVGDSTALRRRRRRCCASNSLAGTGLGGDLVSLRACAPASSTRPAASRLYASSVEPSPAAARLMTR